ncbi:MAG: OsmC family protein [Spirochaetota bacterium]
MKSRVTLTDNMSFKGELDGFDFMIDADPKFGGQNKGPKPKGLCLTALSGCTAMDVISILRKMKAEPDEFWVESAAEVAGEHPKAFTKIIITYYFKGGKTTKDKVEKAVALSQETYCGVYAMLSKAAPIETKIVLEE